jgi:polyisoprenoid-binding protein YceI
MKTLVLAASVAATALSFTVGATQARAQAATHQPTAVRPGAYLVEPNHTQIGFSVLHMGFTYYSGSFSNVSGTLQLDPSKLSAAKLDVTIPIGSVATTSTTLDGELKGPQWFDAAKYPSATFTSTKVTPVGKDGAEVAGNLTLHGVTLPETLTVRFIGAGTNPLDKKFTVGFEATGTIKRSDFGVKTYVPLVGDDVRLTIAGAFELKD